MNMRLSGNCRDFSTFRRKKRVLARNTPTYGGYHGNSQRSKYELMPALRPKGYYTHLSAMYFHGLLNYQPQSLYFNHEQQARLVTGNLEQSRIDNAFKKKQRLSGNCRDSGIYGGGSK